jgi:Zn-finger nucleic acid-binding protein
MTTDRSLECPVCETGFDQRTEHGITVDRCPDCGGVWLDPGELEQLTGSKSHSRHRDIDIDVEDEEEDEEEGGILGTIAGALGGGEEEEFEEAEGEFGEEEAFEEEEEFGEEEEFEMDAGFEEDEEF